MRRYIYQLDGQKIVVLGKNLKQAYYAFMFTCDCNNWPRAMIKKQNIKQYPFKKRDQK